MKLEVDGSMDSSTRHTQRPMPLGSVLTVALAACAVIGLLRDGPELASASLEEAPLIAWAPGRSLAVGESTARSLVPGLGEAEDAFNLVRTCPAVMQLPLDHLRMDPFRGQNCGSSGSSSVDPVARLRDEGHIAALNAVQALQLQSIIDVPNHRACLINNTMYRQGQQVDIFVVEGIDSQGIILRTGAYRFGLRIRPRSSEGNPRRMTKEVER